MISFEKHIKHKNIALGKSIQNIQKIYLDTKYWVDFCDISLGGNNNKDIKEIYDICKMLVNNKKAIFPISYRIFSELMKQTNKEALSQTIEIIECLSQGITIISENERINLEILYFLRSSMQTASLYEPTELVWTKVSNVMGILAPEVPSLTHQENILIKKNFFDHIWEISLNEMISKIGINALPKTKDFADILNKGKFEFLDENNTLHQTFMSEIGGLLDENKQIIMDSIKYLYNEIYKSTIVNNSNEQNDIKPFINLIYHMFNKEKNDLFLPTWDITAKIHSLIRWDKKRKYKDNDRDDIGHTVTALPYFDYFFTEKSFASLIKQSKYNEKYHCCVAWKYNEVLEIVKNLESLGQVSN